MSLRVFKDENNNSVILYGNDTDVTNVSYIRFSPNHFIETSYFTELLDGDDFTEKYVQTRVLTRAQMDEWFELQYGSPMMCLDREQYNLFMNQTW